MIDRLIRRRLARMERAVVVTTHPVEGVVYEARYDGPRVSVSATADNEADARRECLLMAVRGR